MLFFFFFNDTATTEIYTLSLHDALPIAGRDHRARRAGHRSLPGPGRLRRRGIGHARERRACGRRAAATEPGTARLGEMSAHPRAGARGQAHRGTWSGAPQVAGEGLDHRTLGDLRGDTRAAVSHVPTRLPAVPAGRLRATHGSRV